MVKDRIQGRLVNYFFFFFWGGGGGRGRGMLERDEDRGLRWNAGVGFRTKWGRGSGGYAGEMIEGGGVDADKKNVCVGGYDPLCYE